MDTKELSRLAEEFVEINIWEDRYKALVRWGKELESLSDNEKSDDLKVKGCQSQVWLKAELVDGHVKFRADSDAILVKGLLALILSIYSDKKPEEILKLTPEFLRDLGLEKHLSPNRANGVLAMIKQIFYYAQAFLLISKQA